MNQGKKLKLTDFKVHSFVTELDEAKKAGIKGGCSDTLAISGCYQQHTYTGEIVCCT